MSDDVMASIILKGEEIQELLKGSECEQYVTVSISSKNVVINEIIGAKE